jgi:hypothetical protein
MSRNHLSIVSLARFSFPLLAGVALGVTFVVSCDKGPGESRADTGGGSPGTCGSCAIAGPLETADTDLAQLESGGGSCNVSVPNAGLGPALGVKLAEGPIVITDFAADATFTGVHLTTMPKGSDPATASARFLAYVGTGQGINGIAFSNRPNVHGARMFVGEGEEVWAICDQGNATNVSYSGFHPYAAGK